jgi:hypothetical protein
MCFKNNLQFAEWRSEHKEPNVLFQDYVQGFYTEMAKNNDLEKRVYALQDQLRSMQMQYDKMKYNYDTDKTSFREEWERMDKIVFDAKNQSEKLRRQVVTFEKVVLPVTVKTRFLRGKKPKSV